jgi:hypothetical protein
MVGEKDGKWIKGKKESSVAYSKLLVFTPLYYLVVGTDVKQGSISFKKKTRIYFPPSNICIN